MADRPHWLIVILIGAAIGAALPHLFRSIAYLFRHFKKHPLTGEWHEYHWSFLNDVQRLVIGKWIIRRGYFHKLAVEFTIDVDKPLKYKGHIILERGHMIAMLEAVSHDEHLFYRFINPIPSNESRVGGLWMSYDHDGDICCSASLLSRSELKEEFAQREIKVLARMIASVPIIRIK